jgi:hypothetical protein
MPLAFYAKRRSGPNTFNPVVRRVLTAPVVNLKSIVDIPTDAEAVDTVPTSAPTSARQHETP